MMRPRVGGASLTGRQPAIGCRFVTATPVKFGGTETSGAAAPDDHICAAPHSRMRGPRNRSARGGDCLPAICHWVIAGAVVEVSADVGSAPHNHASTSPDCAVIVTCRGRAVGVGCYPCIIRRVIAPPVIQNR